jgi:hypothetical protein
MAYNGSGVFARLYSWVTDRNNNIKIRADRMDAELDGFATGLSNCITKDGQTTVSANIPFNDKKITGLGDATSAADALNQRSGDARYLELDGTGTMTGVIRAADGTVSAPGVTFGADLNSGLYRIGTDNIGAAVNGAKVLDIATTGLGVVRVRFQARPAPLAVPSPCSPARWMRSRLAPRCCFSRPQPRPDGRKTRPTTTKRCAWFRERRAAAGQRHLQACSQRGQSQRITCQSTRTLRVRWRRQAQAITHTN